MSKAHVFEAIDEYYYSSDSADDETPQPDEICLYNIPYGTQTISCSGQGLDAIPVSLPDTIIEFDCSRNNIAELPAVLPPNLAVLDCSSNCLQTLPAQLPATLTTLICTNNSLAVLPDLPQGLSEYSDFSGNPLEQNYPRIFAICKSGRRAMSSLVAYVNARNADMRKRELQARMLQWINPNNIFLEIYMRRMMHPRFLKPLLHDENIEPDDFISQYIETL